MSIDINSAWEELKQRVSVCQKCELCHKRINTVLGEGDINSRVVLIGEAPGEDEDREARPFVGRAGKLLTNILEKGGNIPRDSVYITNTIKCRPPENRNPNLTEVTCCREYLEAQLLLLRPKIVVTLGNIPTKALLNTSQGITNLRGRWQKWRGIDLLPMFHPSFLLRNGNDVNNAPGSPKFLTWQDVKSLKIKIDEIIKEE